MHDGYRIDDTARVFMQRSGSFAVRVTDETAKKLIRNTYHVLLTRGMLGTYVNCEDPGLRDHLRKMLIEPKPAGT